MPDRTLDQTFDTALREHQAGNLAEAEGLYRQVLLLDRGNADAMHLLGVLALQAGRADAALVLINRAISIKPAAAFFANLGLVLAAQGKWEEAIVAYGQAIAKKRDFPEAHNNLGTALRQTGRLDPAIASYRLAIEHRPDFAEANNNLGLALCDAEQLVQAMSCYRRAITLFPNYAEARNNLGMAYHKQGDITAAIACWREALSINPRLAEAHNNIGNALKQLGKLDEAMDAFHLALEIQPHLPEALNNIGVILCRRARINDAIVSYRRAVEMRPEFAEAHYNLAIALRDAGDITAAISTCQAALELRPNWPQASNNLGIWLGEAGRPSEALTAFDRAIAADVDYAEAHANRGNVLRQLGRVTEAIESYRHAIALRPDYAEAYSNLGTALHQSGQLQPANEVLRLALSIQPNLGEAYNNLGNILKEQGELDEAIDCYERAVEIDPANAAADSNRVYTLHFHPGYDAESILAEHQLWNARHAQSLATPTLAHDLAPFPRRTLRIGYVSPDFRDHCQALFTVPLLANHDHDRFEIFCYSDVAAPDAITRRLGGYADTWRTIAGMSDARVADLIHADKIDILVDLTVHMAHNRLLVFARRPAPLQVTWLGYPGTTGLSTMDYRLSDFYLDPPGNDRYYTEQTIRLPDSFWCYDPLTTEARVNALPALRGTGITFGCLNNFCKINDDTLRLWSAVMRKTARSRLLLLAPEGAARLRLLETMNGQGIDNSRIEFVGRQSRAKYLQVYHRIDMCLDTFPYNGHTTSLDSAWMGVPTITQIGTTAVGRGGWSQLCNLGMPELAADTEEHFVELASTIAADISGLRELRGVLRDRLLHSPLMNAPRFARNLEAAYRTLWERKPVNPAPVIQRKKMEVAIYEPAKRNSRDEMRQAS